MRLSIIPLLMVLFLGSATAATKVKPPRVLPIKTGSSVRIQTLSNGNTVHHLEHTYNNGTVKTFSFLKRAGTNQPGKNMAKTPARSSFLPPAQVTKSNLDRLARVPPCGRRFARSRYAVGLIVKWRTSTPTHGGA